VASGKACRLRSHQGGLSVVKRFDSGKTTTFWRRWNSGWRRRPLGGSIAWGGEGESEGQLDWRREVHGGELTKAAAMAVMAASKPATPTCLQ
jgi:hypothetical protein